MQSSCQTLSTFLLVTLVLGAGGFVPASFADANPSSDSDSLPSGEADVDSGLSGSSQQADTGTGTLGSLSKLSVHGFLTQAYATATFAEGGFVSPNADEVVLGIPEDGTTSYRALAIQFRYAISPKDTMIIQLSSRQLGDSPIGKVEDEIELDWAFYERRIADNTSLKVGRIQVPVGIFNEVRDVGTVLPFYRPSFAFYGEGTFTTETVDGASLAHVFAAQSDWSLETNLYWGEWDIVEINPFDPDLPTALSKAENGLGVQFWLNTPSPFRFGIGAQEYDVSGGLEAFRAPGTEDEFTFFFASAELVLERFVLRAEFIEAQVEPTKTLFGGDFPSYYVQVGFNATEKFRIFLQGEFSDFEVAKEDVEFTFGIPSTEDIKNDVRETFSIALNYRFSPNLVLKLEHHFSEVGQFFFAPVPVPTPSGPALLPIFATAEDGEHTIISFSASF